MSNKFLGVPSSYKYVLPTQGFQAIGLSHRTATSSTELTRRAPKLLGVVSNCNVSRPLDRELQWPMLQKEEPALQNLMVDKLEAVVEMINALRDIV